MQNSKNCLENLSFKQYGTNKLFSFTYLERLHIQSDFNEVFKNGLKLENKKIKILAYKRNDGKSLRRLGLVTSRKIGTAVVRNRTKRRLREIFRTNKHLLEPSLDLIFISKRETTLLNYNDLKNAVLGLLTKAKLCTLQD
ncbi:MAG: ribonuclease P protein component [Endomicrobium sp.]|jgi:ribonuclease P protein component|uniref:ribonuclease P protein component n=1 Tax=Candidatus Endomicrobiellum cubanum TaxID=3242325 RepID=UPI00282D91D2|nr:ribonuclease P protein component [Endomicrobium sp.]MDR2395358.1 ribonuclease P protein component [Endomicrobium sp.]